jgi:pimeloyl-ACP methyl ester carboxylesterase
LVLATLLSACAVPSTLLEDGRSRALRLAHEAGFETTRVPAHPFTLYSAFKGRRGGGGRLVVYIEGDGEAWTNRFTLSPDPTPLDPTGLQLAIRDDRPSVVYLARPCQYALRQDPALCHPRYWASRRFAPEVISATSAAIDHYRALLGADEVELVGYSGGGAVAALVAAERNDVVALTTLVAPLDHAAWTSHHDIAAMPGSRNPADYAAALADIPQIHLVGGDDDVVPALVARSYLARLPSASPARLVVVDDYDHTCCWQRDWKRLRASYSLP